MDEINVWFTLRIQNLTLKEAVEYRVNITMACHIAETWLIIIIIIIIMQGMWNVKTGVIPVIIGATGTISKSFRKYVSTIPGNHDVRELQKTSI
jgi:hypothetical protein